MKIKTLILLLLVICSYSIKAQKIKFGVVDESIVKQGESELDSGAIAEYIHSTCEVRYNFSSGAEMTVNYHHRIKIFKEEGETYGNFEIPYYDREKIKNVNAVSFNYEDGEVIKTKLNKSDIYDEETTEDWSIRKFAIPNVKAGTVIDIKYTTYSPYLNNIPQWYFQEYIPSRYSEFIIIVPEYFILTPIPSGIIPLTKESENYRASNHGEVRHSFSAIDIPKIKKDEYVLNTNDYRSGLKYEISRIDFPDGSVENFASDWNNIATNLMSSDDFGRRLTRRIKYLDPVVEEAILLDEKEKIKYIYDYVVNNFSWNGEYGKIAYSTLSELMSKRMGNIGDLNLLLINLLLKAGLKVDPIVLKSRSTGLLNTSFPTSTELNYVIACVETTEGKLLLDVSSKYIPMGQLPIRATNLSGIIIKEKTGAVIELENPNLYKSAVLAEFQLDPDAESLNGEVRFKKSKFAASKSRIEEDEESDDEDDQDIEGEEENEDEEEVAEEDVRELISLDRSEDIYSPINAVYSESIFSVVRKIGDEIFIDADVNYGLEKNPFEDEERQFPIFYNYKVDLKRIISIKIPEGYKTQTLPEKLVISLPGREALFIYEVKEMGGKILINYSFKINKEIFYGDQYEALKKFYDLIIEKQNEKISLVKE